ncbi:MAG: hypothetical protein V3T67_01585 [Nitrosopumilaceae archaeon]
MFVRSVLVILGVIILLSGIVFHFQGQGIVGPESSFMYLNPDWITYGLQIAIAGLVILGIGIGVSLKINHH